MVLGANLRASEGGRNSISRATEHKRSTICSKRMLGLGLWGLTFDVVRRNQDTVLVMVFKAAKPASTAGSRM